MLDATKRDADGSATHEDPVVDVRIRCIRPDDAPLLQAFVSTLSPSSRHRRFHVGVSVLPTVLLDRLTRFDRARETALVAARMEQGREVLIAEARAVEGEEGPDSREFAVVVADPLQRRGLGARLLGALIEFVGATPARRLYGDVLADNRPMLALAAKFGFTVHWHPTDRRIVRVRRTFAPPLAARAAHAASSYPIRMDLTEPA